MTSWVWPKSISGLRSCRARRGMAASSSARTSLSDPLKARPMGVRIASTMTASGIGAGTLPARPLHGIPEFGCHAAGSGEPLADQRGVRGDVLGIGREVAGVQRLRTVAQRMLGILVDFHDDAV